MKNPIINTVTLALFGAWLVLGAGQAVANQPNLLIMSEDADQDTIPRDSRVFGRVIRAIQNQMTEVGFSVYDETLISLDEYTQDRTRRTRAEILDIASSVSSPPIDVVTNFQIYASVDDKGYTAKVRIRIEGELLQVKSKKYLGNFESISPREWSISSRCAKSRECVLESVGDKTRIIANDVGSVLAEKLAFMVSGGDADSVDSGSANQLETAYEVIFDGFTPDEVIAMEEYLVQYTGYISHRYSYNSNRRTEMWYEGTTSSSRMNRNMNKLLETLDLRGTVTFSGNQITLKKITLREKKKPIADDDW